MRVLILAVLVLFPLAASLASADQTTKSAKLHELATLIGVRKSLENEQKIAQDETEKQLTATFKSMFDNAPNKKKDVEKVNALLSDYLREATAPVDVVPIESIWCDNYGKDLTESEIDQILIFYRSPAGQKAAKAQMATEPAVTVELVHQHSEIVRKAMAKFYDRMGQAFPDDNAVKASQP